MSEIDTLRNALYGDPPVEGFKPDRAGVLTAFTELSGKFAIGAFGVVSVFHDTRANLEADLDHAADSVALVHSDPTAANNDFSIKVGASGAGSWTHTTILADAIATVAQPYVDDAEAAQLAAEVAQAAAELAETNATKTSTVASVSSKQYDWVCVIDDGAGGEIVADAQYDVREGRAFVDGELRTLSDVAVQQDAKSWLVNSADVPTFTTAGHAFACDWHHENYFDDTTNQPISNETIFATDQGNLGGARVELLVQAQSTDAVAFAPGAAFGSKWYHSDSSGQFLTSHYDFDLSGVALRPILRHQGVHRDILSASLVAGERAQVGHNCSPVHDETTAAAIFNNQTVPTRIALGRRNDGYMPLTNTTIDQLICFTQPLTKTQCENLQNFNEYGFDPRIIYADSGGNNGQVMEAISVVEHASGVRYVPRISLSQGGNGLHFHLAFLTAFLAQYPRYATGFLPILWELGLDFTNVPDFDITQTTAVSGKLVFQHATDVTSYTDLDVLNHIRDIFDLFDRRGLLLEANISPLGGTGATYTRQRAMMDKIERTFSQQFVPFQAPLQQRAADDAAYATHLANDTIPISLTSDNASDVHITWWPSKAYEYGVGNTLHKALVNRNESF